MRKRDLCPFIIFNSSHLDRIDRAIDFESLLQYFIHDV